VSVFRLTSPYKPIPAIFAVNFLRLVRCEVRDLTTVKFVHTSREEPVTIRGMHEENLAATPTGNISALGTTDQTVWESHFAFH
jgi:hypothetical protein